METNNLYEHNPDDLQISNRSASFLNEARKWALFLSIMGFIFLGLMLILGFSVGTIFSTIPGFENANIPHGIFAGIYLFIAAVYFFPILFLFRFSVKTKDALTTRNAHSFEGAIKNLRNLFLYMGIFLIVILAFYGLGILAMVAGGAMFNA